MSWPDLCTALAFGDAHPQEATSVTRYRLRFLLQEFDLPHGTTLLGRGVDCHLTIEDPLVSRQHARIVIDDECALVEDLGSRNGVRVDGVVIKGPTLLKDGMRVRLGTQDFLFCKVETDRQKAPNPGGRTTGTLQICASCRLPYVREAPACPTCGSSEAVDENTLTGVEGEEKAARAWSAALIVETLDRALALGRLTDAGRILLRAAQQVEETLSAGFGLDADALTALSARAVHVTLVTSDPQWARWVLDIHRRAGLAPAASVVESMATAHPDLAAAGRRIGRASVAPRSPN
jgi:hypothetical protein